MEPIRQLDVNLWVAERPLKLIVGDIGTRMTIIRLAAGGLFLHSPVHLDSKTGAALDALGPVMHVVAPSKVHHFYAGEYKVTYPSALLYGAPGLSEKRQDLSFDAALGDVAPSSWRDEIEQHVFCGAHRVNEVVFFHRASRTLLLTDLAFNVAVDRTAGARLFYFLSGAAGRFGPHRFMRALIRDKSAAKASVERILGWDFERIVVTHGDILNNGGRAAFAEAFAFL